MEQNTRWLNTIVLEDDMALIEFTSKGLYCPIGDFFIDPWKPVPFAVITHAHSDHARAGSGYYLAHEHTVPLLALRLGEHPFQSVRWGEEIYRNGVKISLHPAGHIIGSAQVRLEYKGEVWVFTGDFKEEDDGISGTFEPLRCHHFITESTFGLPVYTWEPQEVLYEGMRQWLLHNEAHGFTSVFLGYSLGKAQRIIEAIAPLQKRILAHGAIYNTQQRLRESGHALTAVDYISAEIPKEQLKGAVVVAPPSAEGTSWIRKFQPFKTAYCSGWMKVRGNRRRRNADLGVALSDHADWTALLTAIRETGAETVYATHGFQSTLVKYLNEQGQNAFEVQTAYGEEEESNNAETRTEEE